MSGRFGKLAFDSDFEESKHPRDESGKFGSGGGGGHVEQLTKAATQADFDKVLSEVSKMSKEDVDSIAHKYTRGRSKWPSKKDALKAISGEFFDRRFQETKMKQVDKASKF